MSRHPKLTAAMIAAQYVGSSSPAVLEHDARGEHEIAYRRATRSRDLMEDAAEDFRRPTARIRRSSPVTDARLIFPPRTASSSYCVYDDNGDAVMPSRYPVAPHLSAAARASVIYSGSTPLFDDAYSRFLYSGYAPGSIPHAQVVGQVDGESSGADDHRGASAVAKNNTTAATTVIPPTPARQQQIFDTLRKRISSSSRPPKNREANRRAVQQYRQRKKEEVDTLTAKNDALVSEVAELRAQLERVRQGVSPLTVREREELERLRKLQIGIGAVLQDFSGENPRRGSSRLSTDTYTETAIFNEEIPPDTGVKPSSSDRRCQQQRQHQAPDAQVSADGSIYVEGDERADDDE